MKNKKKKDEKNQEIKVVEKNVENIGTQADDEDNIEIVTAKEAAEPKKKRRFSEVIKSNIFLSENQKEEILFKRRLSSKTVKILGTQFILLLIIVFCSVYIYFWLDENKQNATMKSKLQETVTIVEDPELTYAEKFQVDFDSLLAQNADTVAWLKVNNTSIDYPVVQASDNDYYLTRNFNKENNGAGWVFADYRCKFNGNDRNTVIYGHNRRDGSMFGTLAHTQTEEWYNNTDNWNIVFVTPNERCEYKVFSIYQVLNEDYYITTEFTNTSFENFIVTIKSRSIKNFGVKVDVSSQVLTLSTCAGNNKYRNVLHAVKIENKDKN